MHFFFNVTFPLIIVGAVITATICREFFPIFFDVSNNKTTQKETDEKKFYINKYTITPNIGFKPLRFWKQVVVGVLLGSIPLVAFYFLTSDFEFWKKLSLFFTQAAFVTFD